MLGAAQTPILVNLILINDPMKLIVGLDPDRFMSILIWLFSHMV